MIRKNYRSQLKVLYIVILILTAISCVPILKKKNRILEIKVNNRLSGAVVNSDKFWFSWKITSDDYNIIQSSWRIQVSKTKKFSKKFIVWESGENKSNQSILIPYSGTKLSGGTMYYWRVEISDQKGNHSGWSKPGTFTTALDTPDEWDGADWIAYDKLNPSNRLVPGIHLPGRDYHGKDLGFHKLPVFRKEFKIARKIRKALVFVTGLGHYELKINGVKVGDHFLSPGWTDYDSTVLYNSFDVTDLLKKGNNVLGITLGNGFFNVPNNRYRKVMSSYGNPMMILNLKITYTNGSHESVESNSSWKCTPGPVTYSSIYGGETFDNTINQAGWELPGFKDDAWSNALIVDPPCRELIPEQDFPVKISESISAKTITPNSSLTKGYMIDFGQNASGVFQIKVHGKTGDTIKFTPAELLDTLGLANQKATGKPHYYTYILGNNKTETWSPSFTYYGFRYLQVEGATPPGKPEAGLPTLLDIKMLHNRNSSPETGHFETSFSLFNQIDTLIKWAVKSNFQSVLSDCPHREKLGWLEQSYLMGEGIHFNYDIHLFYSKIVDDLITAQTKDGLIPDIAPEYVEFTEGFRDSPEWGSAAIILPWLIYKWYGDIEPMNKSWNTMVKYVNCLKTKSKGHILDYGLGDWFDLGPDRPGFAQLTPVSLTATAIYYHDVALLAKMASVLKRKNDSLFFSGWAHEIKNAFNNKFFDPITAVYSTGSQTAIAMPLALGLVEETNRDKVVENLVNTIEKSGNALTAGDIGFHFLVKALSENGKNQILFRMNARDDVPGYGYQLKKGATALTESWPALENVSNNHLMLGHLMEWFYNSLGGIGQTENSVAYKEVKIEPCFIDEINEVKTSFDSPYGLIVSAWKKEETSTVLNAEIPANSTGVIVIPTKNISGVSMNKKSLTSLSNSIYKVKNEKLYIYIGSGKYEIKF